MNRVLTVELPHHRYPILIGRGLLKDPEKTILPHLRGQQVAVVSNTTVAPLYASALVEALRRLGRTVIQITLPDGEALKNRASFDHIHDELIAARFERKATLIAVGGGVIGDITGYAAATFLRGVPFIQVPTTLLAQVDSSVGGKTGINHPLGKNLIGAFHQPEAVLADLDTLDTLPVREYLAGVAEVLKYGFIRDEAFLVWLEKNLQALLSRETEALSEAIYTACRNKTEVVMADERESGERALLNLGHTFGHAIEAGLGYGAWLHGEAVAAGMAIAAHVSSLVGLLPVDARDRILNLIRSAGLPVQAPDLGFDRWLSLMASDKKVSGGEIRFVLLTSSASAVFGKTVDESILRAALTPPSPVIAAQNPG